MSKKLVIVESPTKAKTISKFLGKEYQIESSFGHIRDLPKGNMGVDIENDFTPKYVIPTKSRKNANNLKKLSKDAEMVYYATDEDREGEAIAWHLDHILEMPDEKTKRITFHEITKEAIAKALESPRELNYNVINAQQARRVLDRLVGYELSPFLWKKIYKGLSAGRVQSVTVRLIVEREREREAFKPQEYWTVEGIFSKDGQEFKANLAKIDGKAFKKLDLKSKKQIDEILKGLKDGKYKIAKIDVKDRKRRALPPFTTSTLQQTANNRLGFSAKQTMMFAQKLYETGKITYMRTDSLNMSNKFLKEANSFLTEEYGKKYAETRVYKSKQKGAQEAHEAVRPTNASVTPESLKVDAQQAKLYDLIWSRAIASQMTDAVIGQTTVDINNQDDKYTFRANGSQIKFEGWLKVFPDSVSENILPELKEADALENKKITPTQHFTEPPARYTEASLVKALEEKGIGRPSTYAPTISTIQDRNYIEKEERRLKPTETGTIVNDLLVEHFPKVVSYEFTAEMEKNLDAIAEGEKEWQPLIAEFYKPFKENLTKKEMEIQKKDIAEQETDEKCEKCSKPMIIKMGRFGKFLACTGFPECKNTKQIDENGEKQEPEKIDEKCPDCGKELTQKQGRFGSFIGCSGYPDCKYIKKQEKSTGVKCDKCEKGEIVTKRSRRGKTFYACNQYPDCKNAYWSLPTGDKCPECKSLLVTGTKDTVQCSNKDCKFKK